MSELHKPLGKSPSNAIGPNVVYWIMGCVAVALLSLSAYIFVDARQSNKTVVALNTVEEPVSTEPPKQPAQPEKPKEEEFDLSKVKPLSPLIPLDEVSNNSAQPVFKPKKPPQSPRRSQWVPDPDLIEKSEFGPLPRISPGNVRPLDAYSQSSGLTGANRVAIILGGLGISQTGTQAAIRTLPSSITMAFSPVGNSLQRWMQQAKREGHEVVLQLPMEPLGYPTINPGPRTLVSTATVGQNLMNLRWALGRMTNYPLVINYLGAGISGKPAVMRPLLQEIQKRGLGYIDDGSVAASRSLDIANNIRLPHASGSIVLDANRSADQIRASLRNLEALAKARGFAIGTASAFTETVDVLNEWSKQAEQRGIVIVPASSLIKDFGR